MENEAELVERYVDLCRKKRGIEGEYGKVREEVIEFGRVNGKRVVIGGRSRVVLNERDRICFPKINSEAFVQMKIVLKELGKLEQVRGIDLVALEMAIKEKLWGEDVLRSLNRFMERKRFHVLKVVEGVL